MFTSAPASHVSNLNRNLEKVRGDLERNDQFCGLDSSDALRGDRGFSEITSQERLPRTLESHETERGKRSRGLQVGIG